MLLAASAAPVVPRTASAQATRLSLGTALQGGAVHNYGIAFIDSLRQVDPLMEIKAVNTRGIQDNVALLEQGKLDIALVFGEVAHELFAGIGRPPTSLKVISVMYSTPGMFVVRADSRYRAIADLKGRRVVWNIRNGGLALQGRYLVDGLGLDPEKDFEAVYIEKLSDGPEMVIEGTVAALWGGGYRWPGFITVASNTRGARFIAPSEQEIVRIRDKHPFLARLVVPAGLYPGQHDPIPTVGAWSYVLARADLEESLGYRLASSLHKVERANLLNKTLIESTVKNTLSAVNSPDMLHPGVLAYYKKAGLVQ